MHNIPKNENNKSTHNTDHFSLFYILICCVILVVLSMFMNVAGIIILGLFIIMIVLYFILKLTIFTNIKSDSTINSVENITSNTNEEDPFADFYNKNKNTR